MFELLIKKRAKVPFIDTFVARNQFIHVFHKSIYKVVISVCLFVLAWVDFYGES